MVHALYPNVSEWYRAPNGALHCKLNIYIGREEVSFITTTAKEHINSLDRT